MVSQSAFGSISGVGTLFILIWLIRLILLIKRSAVLLLMAAGIFPSPSLASLLIFMREFLLVIFLLISGQIRRFGCTLRMVNSLLRLATNLRDRKDYIRIG